MKRKDEKNKKSRVRIMGVFTVLEQLKNDIFVEKESILKILFSGQKYPGASDILSRSSQEPQEAREEPLPKGWKGIRLGHWPVVSLETRVTGWYWGSLSHRLWGMLADLFWHVLGVVRGGSVCVCVWRLLPRATPERVAGSVAWLPGPASLPGPHHGCSCPRLRG